MKRRLVLVAAVLLSAGVHAADPVTVFGLPIGGKIKKPIPVCPFNTDTTKELCWVGKPFVAKNGSRLGTLHMPSPALLPDWAAYASFEIGMTKGGELRHVDVTTNRNPDMRAIMESVSSRFGRPTSAKVFSPEYSNWSWDVADLFIHLECLHKCTASFRSPDERDERRKQHAEWQRVQDARPASP